jgi:hypothetical protein
MLSYLENLPEMHENARKIINRVKILTGINPSYVYKNRHNIVCIAWLFRKVFALLVIFPRKNH